ncbi:hypothetical protein Rrhod_0259 [Rhodococcus rhodnii LMG 5362]|uniref:Uncharacterized protein n=1 Tax=Rhodococcus rhodnii LMG 5362 TaxID=1273125 RepID=R7WWB0_9NOCA|nr:hypothetical protein Rrhod_0259 [Rhodococcus rhodnii LMG 5362]
MGHGHSTSQGKRSRIGSGVLPGDGEQAPLGPAAPCTTLRPVLPPPLSPARGERLRDSGRGPFPVGGWVLPPLSRDVGARAVRVPERLTGRCCSFGARLRLRRSGRVPGFRGRTGALPHGVDAPSV